MTKHTQTKQNNDLLTTIETVNTVELADVTGGCSRCGCGQPDAAAAPQQQQRRIGWAQQ